MSTLIENFLQAINDVSYHNAAEGDNYFREADARQAATKRLLEFKSAMIAEYGKEVTLEVANSRPHLLGYEISDLYTE
jgi:hypothetical protein